MNESHVTTLRRLALASALASLMTLPGARGATPHGPRLRGILTEPAHVASADPNPSRGALPLSFEVNRGQTDGQFQFLVRASGGVLLFSPTRVAATLPRSGRDGKTQRDLMWIRLVNANPAAQAEPLELLPGKSSYFIGSDARKWITGIPNYRRVRYRDVYPGIDVVYYGNQQRLESDFVVGPGADLRSIELGFDGAQSVSIAENGDLLVHTAAGTLRQHKPVVHQEVSGNRLYVEGRYVRRGRQRIGFEVAAYDRSRPLIIDPVLSYSTFLGGSSEDYGIRMSRDSAGNLYIAGITASADFPSTPGAWRNSNAGSWDIFLTKLTPTGTAVLYSTYVGSSGEDLLGGLVVDSQGCAHLGGLSWSSDFPTTPGAYQPSFRGFKDAFVTKLDPQGASLIFSTYIGGSAQEEAGMLALDSSGNVYITGQTASWDYPTTPGAFQTSHQGGHKDPIVSKLNAAGTALLYSTYLGGSGWDSGDDIAVDAAGRAYVVGCTFSGNFPVTPGACQTTYRGGCDAFLAILNTTGTAVEYATFLGGSGDDAAFGVALDSAGAVHITGSTTSANFPVTPGAFRSSHAGGEDGFATKLIVGGSGLVYSTYLGGAGQERGLDVVIDSTGNAYVAGWTTSANFPVLNPLQPLNSGGRDAFLTKLTSGGVPLYSTYLGGAADDGLEKLAVDPAGGVWGAGWTNSANFPTTPGALQPSLRGGMDAFLLKITENRPPVATAQAVSTDEDTAKPITLQGTDPDGDPITFAVSTPPAHGTLTGTPPNVTYMPSANYYGADSFAFTVSDGSLTSTPAIVSITVAPVNDPPVATPQSLITAEDTALVITLRGSDPENDPLTYTVVTPPMRGSLTGAPPNLLCTPNANYFGPDSFTFTVSDGSLTSGPATVAITVTPVNDPPIAMPQSLTTPEDTALPITLTAADIDGDPLTFQVLTQPANGALSGTPPNLTYTPRLDFVGADSFTFQASDGLLPSNVATITIQVLDRTGPVTANVEALPNPVPLGTPITLNATVTDRPSDGSTISRAEYSVDAGPFLPMTAVDGAFDQASEGVTAALPAFQTAGLRTICVRGADSAQNTGNAECILLPVYDPVGGFVTGGGAIPSPAGADLANPAAAGPAIFGFVSKYLPGAQVPSGNLEFQFKAGDLSFKSTRMDWLVVTGEPRAIFHGEGSLNHSSICMFEVDAWDGSHQPGSLDAFGIKITACSGGGDRYKVNATPLLRGNVVIHKE